MTIREAAEIREFAETIVESIVPMESTIGRGYEISDKGRYLGLMEAYEVARAWLASNPADSEMAVDEVWLLSMGFRVLVCEGGEMEMEAVKTLDGDTELILRQSETLLSVGPTYWPCETCKTRGDVRRLARALGITLEEAK